MAFGALRDARSGTGASVGTSTVFTLPASITVTVGDLIYVLFAESASLTAISATDNLGNTYTALNAGTDAGVVTGRAFYSNATVGGSLSAVTFDTTSSSDDYIAIAAVFEGGPVGVDKNPANITSDVTSPFDCPATGVLATATELVVAWGVANHTTVWSATSPMSKAEEASVGAMKAVLASKVVAATTTTTPSFTAASNPTQAILATSTFRQVTVQTVTVTKATVTLTGKTVTVLDIVRETIAVTQAAITLAGKTVTVRETELVAVAKANVAIAGQAVTPTDFFVERITVDAAAVLFTGRTVDLVEIVGGALDLDFINDPSIASKVTCVRAGTANMDNYAGNWSAVAANTLRISDKGLLVEVGRTNSVPNNSWQGAVVGVVGGGGVLPTSWIFTTGTLVREVVALGTENGIDYIDIRLSGASGTTGALAIATSNLASAAGQTWTISAWMKLVAGSLTTGLSASGMVLRVSGEPGGTVLNAGLVDATWKRVINSRTLTGTTAAWSLRFSTVDTVTPIDFTLRIGWPQLEASVSPTSPIRTTTVAVTRAADVVTVNSPPAINPVAGGLFAEYMVPYDALVSSTFYAVQLDDGSTSNRVLLFQQTSIDQNACFVTSGGASQVSNLGHGNVYPFGTVTRSAIRYAANDVAFSNDGLGPVFDTTVTLPVGMNRFGIGSSATGVVNTFAYIRHLKYFDDPPTDAELVEMTTAPVELVGVDHGLLELIGQPVTPTDRLLVTNAAIAFAGQAVTVRETSAVLVTAAAITITGKTVTIRDATVVAVGHGLLALTGKPITIVSAMPVTRATVTFAGKTITIVNSTFQDIPKYIIRGRGSRHDIKGRGSRVFLVTR